ncbi:paternally-expressed gene 3 protein isoform X2 [Choloepus didactylus]|uniref:paternally-expressed gene 3 protein isoform X2 n=1 Tax=Choloepus didactylus TaxID=27675 RepID=UPI00189E145C|nr:paternally-expressed gene 3 protein isoform X2 [Choloepus didactylus]
MLLPKHLSATKSKKSWAPDLYELDSDLTKEPEAIIEGGTTDSEFFHQRFRNFFYVEFVGPQKTLIQLRNLCLDWLQPETHSKEEIIELLVLEQYLTILPERIKPWIQAKNPENCEKLVTLLENYKEMYEPEDIDCKDNMSQNRGESPPPRPVSPPPRPVYSFCSARDRRGRSRDVEFRGRWPYARSSGNRLPPRNLSLPLIEKTAFEMERENSSRGSVMGYRSRPQGAESYQDVVGLSKDRKSQNPIQDNMENYRKLLSLGVQLAEDDGHSHMTQGHLSRSKRSAYPSTSRGLKTMPETKKSTHRRGICEDESSHGVIMEKFIKDVSRSSKSGRARESNDRSQRLPGMPEGDWKDVSVNKRESVIQERGHEGNAFGGGFNFKSNLVSKKRGLERKRRYQFDTDGKGSVLDQKDYARKKPFECNEMRKAVSMSSLCPPSFAEAQPSDFGAMPYVCDECGRSFSVISEFVEHQIMHTRENLYEYGESFIHSVAVSEVQKSQAGGKHFECKECGETFNKSAALTEHRRIHAREYLAECKDKEYEEAFMPSPTLSELQKMYGKEKFYECRVCKETFLHSSALVDHQKTHGRGNFGDEKDNERGEAFKPSPNLSEFQKLCGKEKIYECKVCGETFLHSSTLKEHQKIHTRGNLFENKGKVGEETFIPGQSLKRRQKTYTKEKLCEFKDGGDSFIQSSDLGEHQKIHSRKNLYEGRGYEKSVIHSLPFADSQKSHTITRPPKDEEDEKAFTVSSNPDEHKKLPSVENACEAKPYERSVIQALAFTEPQKRNSAVELSKPKAIATSTIQSSDTTGHEKVHAREIVYKGKENGVSVIHSLVAPESPKSRTGNEFAECDEKGEPSPYVLDRNDQQKIRAGENLCEGGKNSKITNSVIHSVFHTESQKSPPGEEAGEFKKDAEVSVPNANAREHQKARAKKKYIECREYVSSVIHSPQKSLTREKFYECQECGESFALSSDLSEHQKVHDREKPSGSKMYERSVIRSVALTDPQTSYAEEQAQNKCKYCGESFATSSDLGMHQKIYDQEFHGGKPCGTSVIQALEPSEPLKEDPDDTIYECKDCGLGFVDLTDLGDHQKVHSREYRTEHKGNVNCVIHNYSFGEYKKSYGGEQLYECPECGASFVHSSFLFEHQKIHEREHVYGFRGYDEPFMQFPTPNVRKNRAAQRRPPSERILKCHVCGQKFVRNSVLMEHVKIHTGEDLVERGNVCEDTVVPGLAPTEFQRSQTEKKLHECKTCRESFLTHSDLRDHVRRHKKGEPYDYGASYVHTSFLDEPPKGDPPFYECKDCGKSFIHSTILIKHQKLHLEEAAQEIEANFVVRQEVLRIQGSNVEAAEPEVEATEPEVEAAEPEVEAAEPDGEAAEPHGEAEQPDGEAEQPNGDADEPDGAGIEDPEEGGEEPEGKAEEPEGDADEPDGAGIEDPEEAEDQELQSEEPYYSCRERAEAFTADSAHGACLKSHARVIIYEPGSVFGESSRYTERASTSTSDRDGADEKYFRCDICGQLFIDRLSLARHQSSHTS